MINILAIAVLIYLFMGMAVVNVAIYFAEIIFEDMDDSNEENRKKIQQMTDAMEVMRSLSRFKALCAYIMWSIMAIPSVIVGFYNIYKNKR